MSDSGMTKAAEKQLKETLGRAIEFQQIMTMPGWKRIEAYYSNLLQNLTNNIMLQDSTPLSDFENERREVIGIRKLLNSINSDIKALEEENESPRLAE